MAAHTIHFVFFLEILPIRGELTILQSSERFYFLQSVLKPLTVFAGLLICAGAQKSFYASGGQYPPVLPQNKPTAPAGNPGIQLGQNSAPEPNVKKPVYHVEQELADRVNYPRDKQAHVYENATHLNSFKNQRQGAPAGPPENQQAAQQRAWEREQAQLRVGDESSQLYRQRVQQASNRPQSEEYLRKYRVQLPMTQRTL